MSLMEPGKFTVLSSTLVLYSSEGSLRKFPNTGLSPSQVLQKTL